MVIRVVSEGGRDSVTRLLGVVHTSASHGLV